MTGPPQMPSPFRRATWLHTALGLLLPLAIGGSGLYFLENASIAVDHSLRDTFEQRLSTEVPEIIILGNSITAKGIDEAQLEEILGREVAVLTIASSEAPAWYATLKNRVYRQGHRPESVIILNSVESLVSTDASSQKDLLFLDQMMDGVEPVLAQKVLYRESATPRWDHLARQRSKLRRAMLDVWRDKMADAAVGSPVKLIAASNRVFSDENIDYGQATVKPPTVAQRGNVDIDNTLLPDILDLVTEHGGRFYFARVPIAPGAPNTSNAIVLREVLTLLNDRNAGFVSNEIQMRSMEFEDTLHLNASGRSRFTEFFGAQLLGIGVNEPLPIPRATLPYREPSITRKGEGPLPFRFQRINDIADSCAVDASLGPLNSLVPNRLAAAGLPPALPWRVYVDDEPLQFLPKSRDVWSDCEPGTYAIWSGRLKMVLPPGSAEGGDLRAALSDEVVSTLGGEGGIAWVYPGTALVISSSEAWEAERGPMAVGVYGQPFGGQGGKPTVSIGKRKPVRMKGDGGMLVARLRPTKPGEPWRMVIRSPPDGPFLALHGITLGRDEQEVQVFHSGRSTELFAFNVLGRDVGKVDPRYLTFAPPVPGQRTLRWTDEGVGEYALPELDALSDLETGRHSPVAVLEDGALLKRHVRCDEVDKRPGTQCHADGVVRFHPSESTQGAEYSLVFDRSPNHARRTEVWALPGDELEVAFGADELVAFLQGPDTMEAMAEAYAYAASTGSIDFTIGDPDRVWLEASYTPEELAVGVQAALDNRLLPSTSSVTLTIANRSSVPILFQQVTLLEANE